MRSKVTPRKVVARLKRRRESSKKRIGLEVRNKSLVEEDEVAMVQNHCDCPKCQFLVLPQHM